MIKLKVKKYTKKRTVLDLASFHGQRPINIDGSTRFWRNIVNGKLSLSSEPVLDQAEDIFIPVRYAVPKKIIDINYMLQIILWDKLEKIALQLKNV